jgi:hypothetical protein
MAIDPQQKHGIFRETEIWDYNRQADFGTMARLEYRIHRSVLKHFPVLAFRYVVILVVPTQNLLWAQCPRPAELRRVV